MEKILLLIKRHLTIAITLFTILTSSNAMSADKIALVISTLNNPFFVDLKDGAAKKARALGYDLVVFDSQNNPAKELSNVEDAINKKIAILLINPTDSDAVCSSVKAANRKNIPVITLDRGANGGKVFSHITSDNTFGGKMAGELIVKVLKGKGKVVELEGVVGTSAARERGAGFNSVIKQNTGITVVARQSADFDRTKGLNVMENILQSQGDIDAVFAHNDEMALGAIKAIASSGRKILVVGFDGTSDGVKAVNNGSLLATIAQQASKIGSMGIVEADRIINGKGNYIPVSLKLISK